MKIVFFGTPDFVIPIANSLLSTTSYELSAVVTNPDRPVGRKQIVTPSPIKQWAINHQISYFTPEKFDDNLKFKISNLKFDVGILAAYGKIIPQEVIDLFPKGILVIHPSLLPKYRGASPIQAAILNGEKETGVTILQMDSKMDHGPIVSQFKEPIRPDDTNETLTKRLFLKTAPVLLNLMNHMSLMRPIPQDHSLATFTKLLTKDDGKIDWNWKPEKIERFIRAMTPWPGAWTMVNCHSRESGNPDPRLREDDKILRLKILKAHLENEKLILDEVQLEGKKPVTWEIFQKAYPEVKFS